MKRDRDFIRDLLFRYEDDDDWLHLMVGDTSGATEDERRENYHMQLMMDEGLLVQVGSASFRMTSYGHDYLEAIRDDTVWDKAKKSTAKAGGASLRLIYDVASAILKQKVADTLGLPL
nr:DUF2513 domain-containing protein [uncultured Roseovarius sp.]